MTLLIGPRPTKKALLTHRIPVRSIVTLLKDTEGAQDVGSWAISGGYTWYHEPCDARPWLDTLSPVSTWLDAAYSLDIALSRGAVYLHCAAGIHRTGIVAYTYFREYQHLTHSEAWGKLVAMRPVIGTDMGDKLDLMRNYYDG